MATVMFSLIVPIYGVEAYLDKCLESIRSQSCDNFEAILVDDGSPDRCPEICDEYAKMDSRFKVIHKKNGGIVSARQAGVAEATGEYIVCIDGDDWIHPEYLSRFEEAIKKHNPEVVCCGYTISDEKEEKEMPVLNRYGFYNKEDIINDIYPMLIQKSDATYFRPSIWAKAFRTELYRMYQLTDSKINMGEDGACTIPTIYHAESLVILPDCYYFYRVNNSSITKRHKAFRWDGPEVIAQHLEKNIDMDQYDFRDQLYRKIVHELFTVVMTQFYRNEKYKVIVDDIKRNLDNPIYDEAIKKCRFNGSVLAKMMEYSLRYRLMFPIWVLSRIKHF